MKKNPVKGVIYLSLSTLFLISSCKKIEQTSDAIDSKMQLAIASNTDPKSLLTSKTSSLFAYLNTLPYDKALDTLNRYILARGIKTNLSGTVLSRKIQNNITSTTATDPANATPEEMLGYLELPGSYNMYVDDGQLYTDRIIEKSADWYVLKHWANWWRIKSTEVMIIQVGSGPGAGTYVPYFIGFSHSGSMVETSLPVNPVSWDEKINEHFPSLFSGKIQQVATHIAGTISTLGLSTNGEGFYIFNVDL